MKSIQPSATKGSRVGAARQGPSVRRSTCGPSSAVGRDTGTAAPRETENSITAQLIRQLKASAAGAGAAALVLTAAPAIADDEAVTLVVSESAPPAAQQQEVVSEAAEPAQFTAVEAPSVVAAASAEDGDEVPGVVVKESLASGPLDVPVLVAAASEADAAPGLDVPVVVAAEVSSPAVAEPIVLAAASPGATESTVAAAADAAVAAAPEVVGLPPAPAGYYTEVLPKLRALPSSSLPDLVNALVANEKFIAALVNNEAFLDRLAGDDRVVQQIKERKSSAAVVEARLELANELVARQQIMDELKTRGPEAVVALADSARTAIEEVEAEEPTKEDLVQLETAMELLEDSEELMMAVEGKAMDAQVAFSGQPEFKEMEGAVAATEQLFAEVMEEQKEALGGELLEAEREVKEAVKELFTASDVVAEEAIQEAASSVGEATADAAAGGASLSADAAADAGAAVAADPDINTAFDHVTLAVAELQMAYKSSVAKALANAEAKVVGVEEAAAQGLEKTKAIVSQKAMEVEEAVETVAPREEWYRDSLVLTAIAITGFIAFQVQYALRRQSRV